MGYQPGILTGHSRQADPRLAAREFHAAVAQPEMGLVIFFCSSAYDLDALADELEGLFDGVSVVGCTTAGEIGPAGYCEHSLSGASLPAGLFTAVTGRLDQLQEFDLKQTHDFAQGLLQRLEAEAPNAEASNSFAFLMIDGLSVREELVAHALHSSLGPIAMVGGSAGDDLGFSRTHVYHDGRFHTDSAVLVLATTELPFRAFKTQHFRPGEERLVVTEAVPAERLVQEINGLPAAEEYARLVHVDGEDLAPDRFAASPVVVLIDGTDYVRSIQKANPDGSLTFYCAIDEGLVLRVAQGMDLVGNLEQSLAAVSAELGTPQLVLACDCVLRALEVRQQGLQDRVGELLGRHHAVGFNTYGEQYTGVHINQTLTGIAFGSVPGPADG